MSLTKWTAATLTALLLAGAPAMADDNDKEMSNFDARYEWSIEPGQVMLFSNPVSYTGEVIETSNSHRTIKADNGMTIMVPNQALLWNGDTQMFSQATNIGDEVVIHMRTDEPYRIMSVPTPSQYEPMMAIGSYDGVFYFSQDFIADLDLDNLDNNIYADYDPDKSDRIYDVDLASSDDNDNM
ncbi:MAG: hypothetical protein KC800_04890 [Candidatus Eremiobacteraeota bacterium]|nr:hypothetical protein [Candidatus Eremiobacteraeota bacterium]